MTWNGAVLDLGRPVGDHDHRVNEPGAARLAGVLGFAAGPPGAQRRLHFLTQPAAGLEVEGLVDRLG